MRKDFVTILGEENIKNKKTKFYEPFKLPHLKSKDTFYTQSIWGTFLCYVLFISFQYICVISFSFVFQSSKGVGVLKLVEKKGQYTCVLSSRTQKSEIVYKIHSQSIM